MAAMKWKKSPEALVKRFDAVVPREPRVERRSMFGYPCAFLGGHMFCGLFQDHFVLRLPDEARASLLEQKGATVFEPMQGRPMREYVVIPPETLDDDAAIASWLRIAREHVAGLPPKAKKPRSPAKKAARTSPRRTAKPGKGR